MFCTLDFGLVLSRKIRFFESEFHFSEFQGRHVHFLTKAVDKVRFASESCLGGYQFYRFIRLNKKFFGSFNALVKQICIRRKSRSFSKNFGEVGSAEMYVSGNFFYGYIPTEIVFHICLGKRNRFGN